MSSQDEVLAGAVESDDGSTVLRRIGDNPRCQDTANSRILPEMTAPPDDQISDRLQTALWAAAGLAILVLLYALSPILTPFLLAGILAYICNPLTDRITGFGVPRMVAVLLVILALAALGAGLVLIVLPLLYEEAAVLAARTPEAMALANEKLAPWLRQNFGLRLRFDSASLQKLAAGNWDTVQVILERIYSSLKIGGVALVGLAVNLMLAPVVLFYLLLDWHGMIARVSNIVPRPWHEKIDSVATDIDAVLSQYLRGQILVMAILAAYYCVALWLAGHSLRAVDRRRHRPADLHPLPRLRHGTDPGPAGRHAAVRRLGPDRRRAGRVRHRPGTGELPPDALPGRRAHRPAPAGGDLRPDGLRPVVRLLRRAGRAAGLRRPAGRPARSARRSISPAAFTGASLNGRTAAADAARPQAGATAYPGQFRRRHQCRTAAAPARPGRRAQLRSPLHLGAARLRQEPPAGSYSGEPRRAAAHSPWFLTGNEAGAELTPAPGSCW
jgi:hypothetical protein